jgi:hypothetical protein
MLFSCRTKLLGLAKSFVTQLLTFSASALTAFFRAAFKFESYLGSKINPHFAENLGCFLECAEVVIEVQFEAATRASEAPSVRVVPKISGILMYYRIYRQRYTCDLQNSHFGQLSSPPMRDCNVYV